MRVVVDDVRLCGGSRLGVESCLYKWYVAHHIKAARAPRATCSIMWAQQRKVHFPCDSRQSLAGSAAWNRRLESWKAGRTRRPTATPEGGRHFLL
jgi:hypothetical protein